jgi:hypothetical protein
MLNNLATCFLVVLSLLGRVCSSDWDIALKVTTQVGGAYGGEAFETQPVVAVNNLKGELQSSFEGRVTAQLLANNAHRAILWKDGDAAVTVSQDIIDGKAHFAGLGIDLASAGYQLQFTLYDEYDLVMGSTTGEMFAVEVGNRFILDITTQPESAYGGNVFGSQPVLAIKDRGGNIVRDVNEGTVSEMKDGMCKKSTHYHNSSLFALTNASFSGHCGIVRRQ